MTWVPPDQSILVERWLRDFRGSAAFDSEAHSNLPAPHVIAAEIFQTGGFQKIDGEWLLSERAMDDWLEKWGRR